MDAQPKPLINSTAGAIPVKNQKGQITMEKVKVARYVTGKRPEYAPYSSDEDEDDDDEMMPVASKLMMATKREDDDEDEEEMEIKPEPVYDRRLERLTALSKRTRDDDDDNEDDGEAPYKKPKEYDQVEIKDEPEDGVGKEDDDDDGEGEMTEEEIQRRRELMKARSLVKAETKESMEIPKEEEEEENEAEESEYEEYTDEENDDDGEEDQAARMKPVFISKENRKTITDQRLQQRTEEEIERAERRLKEERRRETLRELEAERQRELAQEEKARMDAEDFDTGDENEEEEYEAWKVRELKRQKRDREERENHLKEKEELERRRNLTEEEKAIEDKLNPKVVVNKAAKGKYRYLQKYYHRGVFYLDKEEEVLKRDTTAPTLEDHFDKTALPKAMQVKNFGRSGRTKYTHLVDQDTTKYDCPWSAATPVNLKFQTTSAGGLKQGFDLTRRKRN